MRVFEYGSGHSTLWWAKHTGSVVSCEHDEKWYQTIKDQLPDHVDYHHVPLVYGGEYSQYIKNYQEEFDIVVVDGRDRINCAKNAVGALKKDGVLIWDNSDRHEYREGMLYLKQLGFKQIDFFGHGPVSTVQWNTSIFYRRENSFCI